MRVKTGLFRWVTHWTIIPPTLARADLEKQTRKWDGEGKLVVEPNSEVHTTELGTLSILLPVQHHIVVWYHDESIFYAHDCHKIHWVHTSETAKPYAKGEGQSYMISDFISADYGWLAPLMVRRLHTLNSSLGRIAMAISLMTKFLCKSLQQSTLCASSTQMMTMSSYLTMPPHTQSELRMLSQPIIYPSEPPRPARTGW